MIFYKLNDSKIEWLKNYLFRSTFLFKTRLNLICCQAELDSASHHYIQIIFWDSETSSEWQPVRLNDLFILGSFFYFLFKLN